MHPTSNLHWYIYAAEGYHPAGVNQNPYLDMEDKTYDDEIYTDVTTGIRWYKDNIKLSASLFYLEHDGHIFEASEQLDPSNPNAFAFLNKLLIQDMSMELKHMVNSDSQINYLWAFLLDI